jgi:xanthine dehydrogenase accessory factor
MANWLNQLQEAAGAAQPCVIVAVAAVRGSAPREPGAVMLVTASGVAGTIGGGSLEFAAIERGRQMLHGGLPTVTGGEVLRYVLGTTLRQCCGGVAYLHFERFDEHLRAWVDRLAEHRDAGRGSVLLTHRSRLGAERAIITASGFESDHGASRALQAALRPARLLLQGSPGGSDLLCLPAGRALSTKRVDEFVLMRPVPIGDFRVVIFGAGHVGRAVVRALAPVVDDIVWCDGREEEFPSELPSNTRLVTGDPFTTIESMPAATFYLVMTHSHGLDLALCEAVLQRGDQAYLGLIGSKTKRRRFEKHLRAEGLSDVDLARLTCPIGLAGIRSKEPAFIAVSVAAQLLEVAASLRSEPSDSISQVER